MLVKDITIKSKGVVARKAYQQGEIIAFLSGEVKAKPDKYTIQVGRGEHVLPDNEMKFLNHHCNANARVLGMTLVAARDIPGGEELTIDYNFTEEQLSHPFQCQCCGKWIRGNKTNKK